MGENSNIWKNSNIDSVVEKLKTRKDTLSRLILTQGPAAALEVKTVNLEELSALLKRAGEFVVIMSVASVNIFGFFSFSIANSYFYLFFLSPIKN